jgi:hypothetical protein
LADTGSAVATSVEQMVQTIQQIPENVEETASLASTKQ